MEDERILFGAIMVSLGFVIGFCLYLEGLIPVWAIFAVATLVPLAILAAAFVVFIAVWMASGSH